jgi:hypothetical protein
MKIVAKPAAAREVPRPLAMSAPASNPMAAGVSLGRIFGIRVLLHPSVLVIVALILVSLAEGAFKHWHPDWPWWTAWSTALAATLLFLASLWTHELAHSVVARKRGVPVPQITLFMFGGVAEIAAEPADPRSELLIAIVGPLTSVLIGIAFAFVGALLVPADFIAHATADPVAAMVPLSPLAKICVWLAPVKSRARAVQPGARLSARRRPRAARRVVVVVRRSGESYSPRRGLRARVFVAADRRRRAEPVQWRSAQRTLVDRDRYIPRQRGDHRLSAVRSAVTVRLDEIHTLV